MRLIDFLETKHDLAVKTAALRDYQELISSFEKVAQDEKLAGPVTAFYDNAIKLLKSPFKSQANTIIGSAGSEMLRALHGATAELENLRKADPKYFMDEKNQKLIGEVLRLKGALEKPVSSKWPLGAFAAGTALTYGAPMASDLIHSRLTKAQHKDNLEQIAGDKAIPQNLRDRARDMYGILVRYAPTIALDPVFSKDFTKNLVRHDTVDHKIVADLIEAEKIYKESKGRKAEFLQGIGQQALSHSGWL